MLSKKLDMSSRAIFHLGNCPTATILTEIQVVNRVIVAVHFVAVPLTKNVDHISRTLNMLKLHQYLISLLRKMQNTHLEPAIKRIWQTGKILKKEIIHQLIENYF
jgi:hypothetical protein